MGDVDLVDAWPSAVDVLKGTHYGTVWVIGLIAAAVLAATSLFNSQPSFRGAIGWLPILVFAYTRSLVSHAAERGDISWLVLLDWVHLLLIAAWVGEVLFATVSVFPRLDSTDPSRKLQAAFAQALSRSATLILGGVLVTGLAKAWLSVGTPDHLLGNTYGAVLITKVVFVGVAIALGGFNRFVVLPQMGATQPTKTDRSDFARNFLYVLKIEAVILICVTVIAAVLSGSAPPSVAH